MSRDRQLSNNPFRLRSIVMAAVAAGMGLGACGGAAAAPKGLKATTTTAPQTTTTAAGLSIELQGQEFLAAVAPYQAAVARLKRDINASPMANQAEIAAVFNPMATATQNLDNSLLQIGFTGQGATDVRAFVTDDGAVIADLTGITAQDVLSGAGTLSQDIGTANGALRVLATDVNASVSIGS